MTHFTTMPSVGLIDPGFNNTLNLGDQIISDSIRTIIKDVCGPISIHRVSSHTRLESNDLRTLRTCRVIIVGGTNLLKSEMRKWRQWKIYLADTLRLKPVLLMGVGWWQYQEPPELYSRLLWHRLLRKDVVHSVRDSYTARQLSTFGIYNTINTSCPTLWSLTEDRTALIPFRKADSVVVTLTNYNKSPKLDQKFLSCMVDNYDRVYFWPQSDEDIEYASSLCDGLSFLEPTLAAYDRFLKSEVNVDYVGTRLHGGIRAMQYGKRSIIIAIDNRATEIGRDVNLPVVSRDDLAELQEKVASPFRTSLSLPVSAIHQWCEQLQTLAGLSGVLTNV